MTLAVNGSLEQNRKNLIKMQWVESPSRFRRRKNPYFWGGLEEDNKRCRKELDMEVGEVEGVYIK